MSADTSNALVTQLQAAYQRLTQVFADEAGDLQQIDQLLDLISELSAQLPEAVATGLDLEELESLLTRVKSTEDFIRKELKASSKNIGEIKKGKRAIGAYRPMQSGMGYTEGKFFDLKK